MMRFSRLIILVSLFLLSSSGRAGDFRNLVKELRDYSLDYMKVVEISESRITLPYGILYFDNGKIYMAADIDGKPTAAFFNGRGKFIYNPPDSIEMQQVKRFYGHDSIILRFSQAYFVSPSIMEKLNLTKAAIRVIKPGSRIKRFIKNIRDISERKFKYDLPLQLGKAIIENQPDFLWIDIMTGRYDHTIYLYNPYDIEQVSVYKLTAEYESPRWVSSYRDSSVSGSASVPGQFDLFQYDIDADISTYARSNISCTMSMTISADSLKFIQLNFPREYRLDRVSGDVVDSLSFFKGKDQPGANIELAVFRYRGDTVRIGLQYRTNLFYHFMQEGVIQNRLTHWYPYHGFRQLSEYRTRYKIDKGYSFIAVGERVIDSTYDGQNVFGYRSPSPTAYVSFNYGLFDTLNVSGSRIPITIYPLAIQNKSLLFGNPNIQRLAGDVQKSFELFDSLFIPYRFPRLDVAPMAVGYGQGSPGFVHLPNSNFNRTRPGLDDKLRAHEVAHQWWGHTVHPATYHDIWLSEGLAEYSAALYIEKGKKDLTSFRDILKNWRESIVHKGGKRFGKSIGFRAGSMYLGWRLATGLSPADYENLVYYKAAYMLHMLRYELDAVSDERDIFCRLLSRYAMLYSGKMARTADFIEIARGFLGDRTDLFFKQWLYGWQIPKINKKNKIQKDGSVVIYLYVSEIPDYFETPYPVRFIFSYGSKREIIYRLKAGENQFRFIPDYPAEVKAVEFNPHHDILEQ